MTADLVRYGMFLKTQNMLILLPPHLTSSDAMIVAFRGAFVMRATSPKHWPDWSTLSSTFSSPWSVYVKVSLSKIIFRFFKKWDGADFKKQLGPFFEEIKPLVLRKLCKKLDVKRLFWLINKNRVFYPKSVIFWLVVVVDLCFLDFAPQKMKS